MGPHHCQVPSALPAPHTSHLSCHPPLALHLLLRPQLGAGLKEALKPPGCGVYPGSLPGRGSLQQEFMPPWEW